MLNLINNIYKYKYKLTMIISSTCTTIKCHCDWLTDVAVFFIAAYSIALLCCKQTNKWFWKLVPSLSDRRKVDFSTKRKLNVSSLMFPSQHGIPCDWNCMARCKLILKNYWNAFRAPWNVHWSISARTYAYIYLLRK